MLRRDSQVAQNTAMLTLLFLYVGSGALLSALSLPLIFRRIPPNGWYGFRVKATLENPAVWYAVNAYAGRRLLGAGLCTVVVSVGLYFVPNQTVDAYALGCLGIAGASLVLGLIQSIWYLRSLPHA